MPPPLALLLWIAALALPDAAGAQGTAALHGRVTDAREDAVAGARVELLAAGEAPRSTRTDEQGAYRVEALAPGRYRMVVEREGYARLERELRLAAGELRRLDVRLRADTVVLEALVVEGGAARNRERARFESEPGVTARVVGGDALKTLPGLAEADVLRAAEVLPGVVSTSDFSSAFHVRGGSADQNLILLDGFTVFNPFHLGGVFSVFNSDAVGRAELMAGGFGAEYGGRVSSVLDVTTRSPDSTGVRVDAGVSLLAARVLVRSGLPPSLARRLGASRGGWLLSARRSYFDQLLRPVVDFPYHLTDLQAHAELGLRGGGRISASAYGGADVLDLSRFRPPGGDSSSVLRLRWGWGNRLLGVRWQQPVGASWVADHRAGVSGFADALTFLDFGQVEFSSRVGQLTLRSDWSRSLGSGGTLRLGASAERMRYRNLAEAGGTTFYSGADRGWLGAGYLAARLRGGDRWLVEPGVRVDGWRSQGSVRGVVAPRLAAKRFFGAGRDAAAKLAVGRYAQFLHSLRNEELPVSNDTWVLAGRDVPAVVSDQVQGGVERYWGERWYASVEGYARAFRGVTELNVADDPNDPADDLVSGSGSSYGLDLMVRRGSGRLTGWAALSLLRARRTLPDPAAAGWEELPPTTTFAPVFDRRADLDLVLRYLLPGRVDAGLRWNYGSPLPYTRPVAQHFAFRYAPMHGRFEPAEQGESGSPLYVVPGSRNAERYPPYHRLDLTVRRTFRARWGSWTPYLQVLNAYNRRNVLWYFTRYDRVPPTRSGFTQFPILPALGVDLSF